MTQRVVFCAFEPFGGKKRNRSLLAAKQLGHVVVLPVSFQRLPKAIVKVMQRPATAIVLCGEHGSAKSIHVECVARNWIHAKIADNDGKTPRGQVVAGAPAKLGVTWPARQVLDAIRGAGVPARLSRHAGAFACNAALYLALHKSAAPIVGFIHVPANPKHMSLREIVRGLRAVRRLLRRRVVVKN